MSIGPANSSAPNLENFVYFPNRPARFTTEFRTIDISDPPMLKGGAPKLRYIQLDCTNLTFPSLSNITTLRLEIENGGWANIFFAWESFLDILSIPSIANLSLAGNIVQYVDVLDRLAIVHMNNLKHLRYSDHIFMTLLLPFLRAPLLETLSIRKDTGRSEQYLGPSPFGIPASESYFFPSLRTLTLIDSAPSSPIAAWRVMQITKNINCLVISHHDPVNNCDPESTLLSVVQENRPFNNECWPKLTSIIADYSSRDPTHIEAIHDLSLSHLPKPLTLHLFPDTKRAWEQDSPDICRAIEENCTIKEVDNPKYRELLLSRPRWPPGLECPLDYAISRDLFQFRSSVQRQ